MRDAAVGLRTVVGRIAADAAAADGRPVLAAVTGLHSGGKSRVAACIAAGLVERGRRVALIGVAPWSRPRVHFRGGDAVERYHREGVRWEALFDTLVGPLQRSGSISLRTRLLECSRDRWYLQAYDFRDVDVILLVGVFLLRRDLRRRYDSAWWVDASFDASLRRAIRRSRAERDPDAIVSDYQRLYVPAQRLHLASENPIAAATGVIRPAPDASPLLRCTGMTH